MHIQCVSKCHLLFLVGPFGMSPFRHFRTPLTRVRPSSANLRRTCKHKQITSRLVCSLLTLAPGLVYACLSQVIGYSEAQHTSGGQSTCRKPKLWNRVSFFVENPNLWTQGTHLGNWKLRDTQWVILLQTVIFFFCPRLLSFRQLFP